MVGPFSAHSSTTETAAVSPAVRKGPLGHPAVLVLAGVAVLLGAYALGYMPVFGSLLEDAIRSSQSTEMPVLSPAFYGIAGLAAFLILLGLLKSFDLLVRKIRNSTPLKARPAKPVEQFIEEAGAAKISLRVARESYYLLEPHYPHKMCIELTDDLRGDLRLADEAIRALESQLLTRCDRRQAPVAAAASPAPSAVTEFVTVFDLLYRAQTAPPLREDRSGSRERAVDLPVAAAKPERRQSDSAERKALHAATLQAIETGSLHAEGASGLHRRASDYNGPRRRATDNRTDPVFKGPYQRATDRPSSERLATERTRTPSGERKAQPSLPDPAELNRLDPLFIPPLNKRGPEPTQREPNRLEPTRTV